MRPENADAILTEVRQRFVERVEHATSAAGGYTEHGLQALRSELGRAFDDFAAAEGQSRFERARGMTVSKFRLVDEHQLELSIRVGDLAKHLNEACALALSKLHTRLVTLLDRPDLDSDDNPVGAETVTAGLAGLLEAMGEPLDRAISGLDAVENQLLQEMPLLYAELNELLALRQVQPAARRPKPAEGRAYGAGPASEGALTSLFRAVAARAAPPVPLAGQTFSTVNSGLFPGGMGGAPSMGAAQAGQPLDASLLERLLSYLQEAQHPQGDLFGGKTSSDVMPSATLDSLKGGEFGRLAGATESTALDALALLYQVILDDPELPDAVKAALARLQIPLLKLVLLDPSFFDDSAHPARALLDAMAQAAAELKPNADSTHPVCVELHRLATAIQKEFDRNPDLFGRHAAALETFIAQRNHDLQAMAQRYVPLGEAQERRDLAERQAAGAIAEAGAGAAPPVIRAFLRRYWQKVLASAYLEAGGSGPEWQNACAVVTELLWSIRPKPDAEERKRLAAAVPGLLQRIRAGLDRVEVPPRSLAEFLDACFELQTVALRGRSSPREAPATAEAGGGGEAEADAGTAAEVVELQMNGLRLRSLRAAASSPIGDGPRSAAAAGGDWYEFEMPAEERRLGRLSWISPQLANPLFANPEWDCAISLERSLLEKQLASGRAKRRGAQSFFERVAERALRSMAAPSA